MFIECRIEGVAPVLQHRFPIEEHGENKPAGKKTVYVPEEETEKATYRDQDGKIFVPSDWLYATMKQAGSRFKYKGQQTYKNIVEACLVIEPDRPYLMDPVSDQPFDSWQEINTCVAVIKSDRIVRWRPQWNTWSVDFSIENLDPDMIPTTAIKEILEWAGKTKGVGDQRPRYGRFMVSRFEPQRNGNGSKR